MSKLTLYEAIAELRRELEEAREEERARERENRGACEPYAHLMISRDSAEVIVESLDRALKSAGNGAA